MRFVITSDGSVSAYNDKYRDYYHSINDGAILETLYKHIIPAFHYTLNRTKCSQIQSMPIKILDICFGLGYNSFFSIAYAKKWNLKVEIYSPEMDINLLNSLHLLKYPIILQQYLPIDEMLDCINNGNIFHQDNVSLKVFCGNAIEYIQSFEDEFFDIIYQDAFSPSKNPELWSQNYFAQLYRILHKNGIITTYSSASRIRENAGIFNVYSMQIPKIKNGSIFTKIPMNDIFLDIVKPLLVLNKCYKQQ